ncbi:polysaccharide deacetylase family protein [Bacillus sp. JCM 19034]|uniref:polysaccharide deacetylase family protein n=1 Tax=Bacillus sp. JCM 19034 TaxID=1481928 RepID=UPI000780D979|nr:polysaccharide deacetylase family protein [Bacillus sp. JCM 19034]
MRVKRTYGFLICCVLTMVSCNQVEETKIEANNQLEIAEPEVEEQETNAENIVEGIDEELETELEELDYYRVNEENWSIEPIDDGNEQVVLVTIDDAPDKYSIKMAETLDKLGVKAIFFVNGHLLDDDGKRVVKELHKRGFEIGNHTMNHPTMSDLSEDEQRSEIVELNDIIYELIGEYPRFYRAPFGGNTDYTNELTAELGMVKMNWTYGYDWEPDYLEPEPLADIMVNAPLLQNGANLLMHDRKWTADALESIVHGLKEKGYEFVDPEQIKTK